MHLINLAAFSLAYFAAVSGRVIDSPVQRDVDIAAHQLKRDCVSGAAPWAQCGGIGFTGPTVCAFNITCTYSNPYHSQCLPPDSSVTYPVVGSYGQCGGPGYSGPTACLCGWSCQFVNSGFSTCQPA
ncbi:hypothetical protein GALMADRAFT_241767 [Galerina marginata CBS 339.88]|uniref:CBM1 domain-containing protein n=1 Tax=Galerina marginata (strain CBS 339.88) TaxID=685588 RepID=A0A067TDC1_GALM3|nr:hypothetical protein GALMADRAFT_241767 [Galerina marginata CBS 339.88]